MRDNDPRYEAVASRIRAQIWDSVAGFRESPLGFSKAFGPITQKCVKWFMHLHLALLSDATSKHYDKVEEYFLNKPIKAPALMFYSKADPIGTELKNVTIADNFEILNIEVTRTCFERSPHIGHFHKHRKEYEMALIKHLKSCNLISNEANLKIGSGN